MAISSTIKLKFDGAAVKRGLASVKKQFASAIGGLAKISGIGGGLGIAGLTAGFVAFGKAASGSAATLEDLKAQFEILTGSVATTEEVLAKLRKLAVESPLEMKDITDGAKTLMVYGVALDEVVGITAQLSEVSAGNAERFGRLAYAFGQISSVGRLMGTELRQLTETGFNPLEFISKKTSESMTQLKKRMEDGGVSVEEVKEALKAATSEGGRFFGMNEKMSKTFSGKMSMMKDQWNQMTAAFGTGMNEGLKTAIEAITEAIPQFTGKLSKFGSVLGVAITESVNGNHQKFAAIGSLIGDYIAAGIQAALASAMAKGINSMFKDDGPWYGLKRQMFMSFQAAGEMGFKPNLDESFGNHFEAQMRLRGIANQGGGIMERVPVPGAPGYRYAGPGESSAFSDGQGNKVIPLLESIDRKLSPQP